MAEVERDASVQVAILTGAGDKAFCAGADPKELASGSAPGGRSTSEGGFAGFVHARREKPRIAAVNGAAVAGGFELVLACDFAIASVDAVFALPEVKRGLAATAGGVWRLPRSIPRGAALEMIATGEPIDASEALRLGLVNRVMAPEHLIPEAMRIAALAAANAPLALRASLALARRAFDLNDAVLRAEADAAGRRVDPNGALVERVPMPDRSTTNICFGGADGCDAYITLSRSGRLAGRRWAREGLLTPS
ncbi:enoyl-CoA hydratase-related protein [Variovorax sp. YR216]|uniref:enoyl-CoA hydratase-related protein n=1 Tax=Variovorax sp. YR216 TaxID=1882828 RepID=UPI000897FA36|nr:enoyl-CoA hydratase-related protein [Variovorax sp. YR216]SEB18734.1 enoyl-CoA hydratase [Variovorax sp. YR216]